MSGKIFVVIINALALCFALPPPLPSVASSAMTCEFFDKSSCTSSLGCNVTTQVCPLADLDKRTHCYAFWTYDSMGHVSVEMKGCWLDNFLCYDQPRCVSSEQVEESGSVKYYCCCEGNMCNNEVYLANAPDILSPVHHTQPGGRGAIVSSRPHDSNIVMETILYTLVPLTVFAVCIVSAFWIWRRFCSFNRMNQLPPDDPSLSPLAAEPCPDTSSFSQLKLVEIKAYGRFGCLWKGVMSTGHPVAVKVFPLHDQQSWSAERDFYNLLNVCSHANMLKFIGSHNRGNELWLVTEYHEHGSLYDYLKGNTVTMAEAVNMSLTMFRGLAFLHSATNNKPMVAHRDFKSRNVLLRRDFSVCIADFGLALVLDFHPGNVHGQVGTRRYMSPEILDCSINFTVEHFLKIDVYACALVLWEILSRCVLPGVLPGDYQMPFEEEIGIHPSLEDMQDLVVTKRSRPCLKESWYTNEITAKLCMAVEECWDHDPEARLSAECVEERLLNIQEALLLSLTDLSESLADSTSLSEP